MLRTGHKTVSKPCSSNLILIMKKKTLIDYNQENIYAIQLVLSMKDI